MTGPTESGRSRPGAKQAPASTSAASTSAASTSVLASVASSGQVSTSAPSTLARLAWPQVDGASLLAVPLGSCEQHGPHLPLGTDTTVATVLAEGLARRRPLVTVAPTLPYGASGEHAGFTGTLSLGAEALSAVLVEIVRSADAFAGVVLVSAHGGNAEAVAAAAGQLTAEGRPVLAWSPCASTATSATGRSADLHAGWVETSVLLAIDPGVVRLAAAAAGERRPLAEIFPSLRAGGVASVSANGVLGDPSESSGALGRMVIDAWVEDLVRAVERFAPFPAPASHSSGSSPMTYE